MTQDQLCQAALDMRKLAYCPYSQFAVGAAIECADGTVYTGCNIENAAYSPTLCAERVAIGNAISQGKRDFVRIAVASSGENLCVPCGVCRQVLLEFSPDIQVICLGGNGEKQVFSLAELLPHSFDASQIVK